jgi:hypothetical protein
MSAEVTYLVLQYFSSSGRLSSCPSGRSSRQYHQAPMNVIGGSWSGTAQKGIDNCDLSVTTIVGAVETFGGNASGVLRRVT